MATRLLRAVLRPWGKAQDCRILKYRFSEAAHAGICMLPHAVPHGMKSAGYTLPGEGHRGRTAVQDGDLHFISSLGESLRALVGGVFLC